MQMFLQYPQFAIAAEFDALCLSFVFLTIILFVSKIIVYLVVTSFHTFRYFFMEKFSLFNTSICALSIPVSSFPPPIFIHKPSNQKLFLYTLILKILKYRTITKNTKVKTLQSPRQFDLFEHWGRSIHHPLTTRATACHIIPCLVNSFTFA